MKTSLDEFEQSIENNAEKFVPLSDSEKSEVETIINAANKTRNINIRISAYDIEKIKQRSAEELAGRRMLVRSCSRESFSSLVPPLAVRSSAILVRPEEASAPAKASP